MWRDRREANLLGIRTLRYAVSAVALGAVALITLPQAVPEAEGQTNSIIHDGQVGFVMYQFGNAGVVGDQICPQGRSVGYRQQFEQSPEGQRRPEETDGAFQARVQAGERAVGMRNGINSCANPAAAGPDPFYRTMTDTRAAAYGIDLDGQNTTRSGRASAQTCAQDDFRGADGRRGVDNQYARLTACTGQPTRYPADYRGWVPPEPQAAGQENSLLEGSWGVLFWLRGVDDLQNDDDVEVGIYANNDPIQLNPARDTAIHNATYAPKQEPRYRAETRGRIVNGVLTTDPVNITLPFTGGGGNRDRIINRAVVEARFRDNGEIEGYLAGWWPVEQLYEYQYKFGGSPIAFTIGSAIGRTCNGAYHAAYALADGDRDPATGRCTSLSTQYVFRGAPAFIADVETRSVNDPG